MNFELELTKQGEWLVYSWSWCNGCMYAWLDMNLCITYGMPWLFFFAIDPHLVAMQSFCFDSLFFIWIIWNQLFGLFSLWRNFVFYLFLKHYLSSVHEIVKGVRKAWISTRDHWWDDEDKLGSCPSLKVLNWF